MTNANGKFLKGPNYWRPEPKIKAHESRITHQESRIATGDPEDDEEEEEEEEEKKKEEEDEEEEENDGEEDEVPWQVTVPKR